MTFGRKIARVHNNMYSALKCAIHQTLRGRNGKNNKSFYLTFFRYTPECRLTQPVGINL